MPIQLPANDYADDVTERQVALAIFEELRAIRNVVVVLAVLAVPLMLLAIYRLANA